MTTYKCTQCGKSICSGQKIFRVVINGAINFCSRECLDSHPRAKNAGVITSEDAGDDER